MYEIRTLKQSDSVIRAEAAAYNPPMRIPHFRAGGISRMLPQDSIDMCNKLLEQIGKQLAKVEVVFRYRGETGEAGVCYYHLNFRALLKLGAYGLMTALASSAPSLRLV
jgi:hypothetical protein